MQVRRALIATAASLALANMASAAIIDLSTHSSEPGIPASELMARFDFTISGSTLMLEVTNNTLAPDEYNINEIYWNAPDGITLMPVGLPAPWVFGTDIVGAGMFGTFDFGLTGPVGDGPGVIIPGAGNSMTFMFEIGGGSPSESDFVTLFSTHPPGDIRAIVSAKFVFGPGMDSAFGATVPSPGSLALLAVAGVLLGRRRRRAA